MAIHYMEIGGAEISLVGLLHSLDYTRYDVDLFVYRHVGELMEYIPSKVNLLPEIGAYAHLECPIKQAVKDGYLSLATARLRAKLKFFAYRKKHNPSDDFAFHQILARSTASSLPSLEKFGEYDLAISFLQPHNIVLEKVRAKKKICWIHTDYSKVAIDPQMELPVWSGYDHIISISDAVTQGFLKVFPSLKDKIVLMQNILPQKFVEDRSALVPKEEVLTQMPREDGVVNLLSVGRYSWAKNYDNVPDICRHILNAGVPVRWYLIGYGGDESLIRLRIAEASMEKHVIILGKKDNPYPYMQACDVYVQPSRYEGCPVTIQEAQALGKSVIATAFPTVKSAIQDGVNGVIVPLDNVGCAQGIVRVLRNADLQKRISGVHNENLTENKSLTTIYEWTK